MSILKPTLFLVLLMCIGITACGNDSLPALSSSTLDTIGSNTDLPDTILSTEENVTNATETPIRPTISTPKLLTNLVTGCTRQDPKSSSPKEGELAIEFSLQDINGEEYTLSQLLSEKPVYMIFGSFT